MLNYLWFLPQLALLALYDWIFFVNDYSVYPANCWWAFALLHTVIVIEFAAIIFLRHMKWMPLTKKHPILLFTMLFGIQLLFSTVFSLVWTIPLKWVIIIQSVVAAAEIIAFAILLFVQKYRDKHSLPESSNAANKPLKEAAEETEVDKAAKEAAEVDKAADKAAEEAAEEIIPPPQKIKSAAMLLLMRFLSDLKNWGVPENLKGINELTEIALKSTQYSYAEISNMEAELKVQTNALKTYIQNKSIARAENSVNMIIELLSERERQIKEIENNRM